MNDENKFKLIFKKYDAQIKNINAKLEWKSKK